MVLKLKSILSPTVTIFSNLTENTSIWSGDILNLGFSQKFFSEKANNNQSVQLQVIFRFAKWKQHYWEQEKHFELTEL